MKQIKSLVLAAFFAAPFLSANAQVSDGSSAAAPAISPGAAEIVKLAQSGSSDDVLMAYVGNSQAPYNLSADQIIYLKDLGLSQAVVTAMLNRDNALRSQPATAPVASAVAPPAPTTIQTSAPVQAPLTPAPYDTSPPAQVAYFYDQLSPYGSWVNLPGFGWCWQPSVLVINHGWRPYCDAGHWVYTDAGWFWQSDYSWGWAPFHYGRWHLHERCGWVWLPDTVWAPAWVTWRVSGDSCGWAPLPPHADFDVRLGFRFNGVSVKADFDFGLGPDRFTFIAFNDFNSHDLAHRRLPPARVTTVFRQTTIINNYTVDKTTIVNRGIPVERVSAVTHTEFKKVAIHDVPAGQAGLARGASTTRRETAVYRPELKAPARPPAHMVAQRLDESHPVVQHTEVRNVTVEHKPAPAPMDTRRTQIDNTPRSATEYHQPAAPPSQRRDQVENQPRTVVEHEEAKRPGSASPREPQLSTPVVANPHGNESQNNPSSKVPVYQQGQSQNSHVYQPKGYYQLGPGRKDSQWNQNQSIYKEDKPK